MADTLTTRLDPVDGLINYVLFTKPYHTKILEVLVEYIHTDCVDVTIEEGFWLSVGAPDVSLLPLWGWTQEEARRYFDCDWQFFQITEVDTTNNYFKIVGDFADKFPVGDEVVVQTGLLEFAKFTVTGTSTTDASLTTTNTECEASGSPPPDCETVVEADCAWTAGSPFDRPPREGRVVQCREDIRSTLTYSTTQIDVDSIPSNFPSTGVLIPASCLAFNENSNVYTRKAGIVWPSPVYVETNRNCGGYGFIFQQAQGSPPGLPAALSVQNAILDVDNTLNYFVIDNLAGAPTNAGSWDNVFSYGVHFKVINSTNNNSEYIVSFTFIPEEKQTVEEETIDVSPLTTESSIGVGSPPVITITNPYLAYTPGDGSLSVYKNDVLQTLGVDYLESSSDTITWIGGALDVGDEFTFKKEDQLFIIPLGNVVSNIADGQIILEPWGYDEPIVCIDQGQALEAAAVFAEDATIEINNNGANIVDGWDMHYWDIAGWDNSPFTYTVAYT